MTLWHHRPLADPRAGVSLELIDPCADNADGAQWARRTFGFFGNGTALMTPGQANATCP